MNKFINVELKPDEKIVFGLVTHTKFFSIGGTPQQPGAYTQGENFEYQNARPVHITSGTTTGVTNQRVISEDLKNPRKTKIIANAQVTKVFLIKKKKRGKDTLTLEKVETKTGQSLKLAIQGIPVHAEENIKKTFPQAQIVQGKGSSTLLKVIGVLVGLCIFFACVIPFIVDMFFKTITG